MFMTLILDMRICGVEVKNSQVNLYNINYLNFSFFYQEKFAISFDRLIVRKLKS